MILTTTPTIEGKKIQEYRAVVVGEAILGANLFKDFFAGIRDIVGGRSGAYEKELRRAREIAFDELPGVFVMHSESFIVGEVEEGLGDLNDFRVDIHDFHFRYRESVQ